LNKMPKSGGSAFGSIPSQILVRSEANTPAQVRTRIASKTLILAVVTKNLLLVP
jgi:hypothetical protein